MVVLLRLQSIQVPSFFLCPISLDLMKDPVTLCTGMTYDRSSIEKWLDIGNLTCPATNQLLDSTVLTPNHTLRRLIQDWCVMNQSLGVERIPTPKVPARPEEVKAMLEDLKYGINVHETVRGIRSLTRESDKNKRLVVESGAIQVLVSLVALPWPAGECQSPKREWVELMEDALATIALLSSVDGTRYSYVASPSQIACICWFLKNGQIEAKVNAAVVLESIASSSDLKSAIANLEGVIEPLVQLLKEKYYPKAVKASLRCLVTLCATKRNRISTVEAGGVPALVEFLPGAESRSALERALRILELLSSCAEGREAISGHALAIPVLLKLVLRASVTSIQHAVVILYMLSEFSVNASEVRKTIVHVGGFPRLLLLLQTECSQKTKDKAIKLLKQIRPIWIECPCSPGERALSNVGAI